MKFKNQIFILTAVFFILTVGCARPPKPVEQPPPAPFDVAALMARTNFWRDYTAKFRLKVDSKTAKFSARSIVLIKSPFFVRFETFGPIGQTTALYVSNESGLDLLIPSDRVIFTAARPETLIRHFLGVSIPFDVFRQALTACVPAQQITKLDVRAENGVLHALSKSGTSLFDWQFLPQGPDLNGVFIRDEPFEGRISYDPPVALTDSAVPKKIRITSSEWNMEITMEDIQPSQQFQPTAFYLPNLPDVRKVDLDAIHGPQ